MAQRSRTERQRCQSCRRGDDVLRSADRSATTQRILSIADSPSSGDLEPGEVVTLTLKLSEAVTVAGGTPTLTLNDGGTATYTGGSGTNALTFSYTVAPGRTRPRWRRRRSISIRRYDHRWRRQCRQSVAHRPDPDRPADRHHDASLAIDGNGFSNSSVNSYFGYASR